MNILIINTGSRSTKLGYFQDDELKEVFEIQHTSEELEKYSTIHSQIEFRSEKILSKIKESEIDLNSLSAISCIGGLLKPLSGGVYRTSKKMVDDILAGNVQAEHASNIAAVIGYQFSEKSKIPCFIADPISTDELDQIARITGIPDVPKFSRTHALNVKARARRAAKEINKNFDECTFIIVHIGGGLTVNLIKNGKIIDIEDARQFGPMSPEAAGGVPLPDFVKLYSSGKYTPKEIEKFWYGKGGLVAWLGTGSLIEIEGKIKNGDEKAKLVLNAMVYQIAKSIGALYTATKCELDGIVLTGGGAHSDLIISTLKIYIKPLARIFIYPGEEEILTLGELAVKALKNEVEIKNYL